MRAAQGRAGRAGAVVAVSRQGRAARRRAVARGVKDAGLEKPRVPIVAHRPLSRTGHCRAQAIVAHRLLAREAVESLLLPPA